MFSFTKTPLLIIVSGILEIVIHCCQANHAVTQSN